MTARVLFLSAIITLALTGCSWGGKTVEETNDAPIPAGTREDCGDASPIVQLVHIADGGIREFEAGTFLPSIIIGADTTDADGDLTYYEMMVWWDTDIDGFVEMDGLPFEVRGTLSDTECSIDDITLAMTLGLNGTSPPASTEVEFGVRIKDDQGHNSNNGDLATATFFTPDSEGNYPD